MYIWGTENVGHRMFEILESNNIKVLGLFDSNHLKIGKLYRGMTIEQPRKVNEFTIISSYHLPSHLEAAKQILGDFAISAWEFLLGAELSSGLPWFNLRHPKELTEKQKNELIGVANRISENSQPEFWRQVAARHFVGILNNTEFGIEPQNSEYFHSSFVSTESKSIFLDLGAFTGDTLDRFFRQKVLGKDQRFAIALEPDRNNYSELWKNYKDSPHVLTLNAAIASESGLTPFFENKGVLDDTSVESRIGDSLNNTFIPKVTIDQIFANYKFTHAKFDIEGYEQDALRGASNAINAKVTQWAIASYHCFDDLWEIPKYFDDDYEIHVTRHATLPWDTTMYFIPR